MINRLLKAAFFAARACGLMRVLRSCYRRRLLILFYHGVSGDPATQPSASDGRHVASEKFRRQMEYCARAYTVMPLADALGKLSRREKLPPNPCAITFDDGYVNNRVDMFPVIKGMGIPVTIFITTDFVRGQAGSGYLSWDDVRFLHGQGVSFGSHTVTHPHLTQLPDGQVRYELEHSKNEMEKHLQTKITLFSYPYGDYDARIASLVSASGYDAACTVCYGVNGAGTDRFSLRRIAVSDHYSFDYFAAALIPGLFRLVRLMLRPAKTVQETR